MSDDDPSSVLILLPTTGNRIPQLELSIASVQHQQHKNWRLVVMGDGIDSKAHDFLLGLARSDSRIAVRTFEKTGRRGEIQRHELIDSTASDQFPLIAYLCDRDLWFPDHLSMGIEALASDKLGFFAAQGWSILKSGEAYPIQNPVHTWNIPPSVNADCDFHFPLSSVIHTRKLYNRSIGWAVTPKGIPTDVFMWYKLLKVTEAKVVSHPLPSYCYFSSVQFRQNGWHDQTPLARQALAQLQHNHHRFRLTLHNDHLPRVQAQYHLINQRFLWFYRGRNSWLHKVFRRWNGFGRPRDFTD